MSEKHTKMFFRISTAEGDEIESMWVRPCTHENYEIDNIPFYAMSVACGDIVRGSRAVDGGLYFDGVVKTAEHSTIRVIAASQESVDTIRTALRSVGCSSEVSDNPRLIAVDIPPTTLMSRVHASLRELGECVFDFEESCLSDTHRQERGHGAGEE